MNLFISKINIFQNILKNLNKYVHEHG